MPHLVGRPSVNEPLISCERRRCAERCFVTLAFGRTQVGQVLDDPYEHHARQPRRGAAISLSTSAYGGGASLTLASWAAWKASISRGTRACSKFMTKTSSTSGRSMSNAFVDAWSEMHVPTAGSARPSGLGPTRMASWSSRTPSSKKEPRAFG